MLTCSGFIIVILFYIFKQTFKILYFIFKKFYLLFLEWGRGEKERERNINVWLPLIRPLLGTWPATQSCALDWESNW